jgi:glycosidase
MRLEKRWRSSRDSARTPVQWDDSENAGFTTGTPWFYVNQNYKTINVAQQEQDPDSILNFYKRVIKLRKTLPVVRYGRYKELRRRSRKLYMYTREMPGEKLLVVCSFSKRPMKLKVPLSFDLSNAKLILTNYPTTDTRLQPYECRVYHLKEV